MTSRDLVPMARHYNLAWPAFAMPLEFEAANGLATLRVRAVCKEAIIRLFRVVNRYVGNLPPLPAFFPTIQRPMARAKKSSKVNDG